MFIEVVSHFDYTMSTQLVPSLIAILGKVCLHCYKLVNDLWHVGSFPCDHSCFLHQESYHSKGDLSFAFDQQESEVDHHKATSWPESPQAVHDMNEIIPHIIHEKC
jgi:hypothetical protein